MIQTTNTLLGLRVAVVMTRKKILFAAGSQKISEPALAVVRRTLSIPSGQRGFRWRTLYERGRYGRGECHARREVAFFLEFEDGGLAAREKAKSAVVTSDGGTSFKEADTALPSCFPDVTACPFRNISLGMGILFRDTQDNAMIGTV
jgi:hypothetical protein